jgi:methylthioxylose transferase
MSASATRPRIPLTGGVAEALPRLGTALAAVTITAGLAIKATTGALGSPLPPFLVAWGPGVDPLAIVSVAMLVTASLLAPRVLLAVRQPIAFALGLYGLGLALGLALNVGHEGTRGWWSVFSATPGGSKESAFEYLPGLPALRHGAASYLAHFAQLVPSLPLHAAGNPPGPLIALHVIGIATPGALAALCIGVGALTAPLAYDLGRTLGDEEHGRTAGLLTAFTPSLLLFGVTSADYAFATLALWVACLLTRTGLAPRIAGAAVAAVASLFSWLLLAIPVWATLVILQREGTRHALACAALSAIAILALNITLALATGYDPIATLRATDAVYRHTTAARPYAYWLFGSPVAWGVMLGLPTATLALRAVAQADPTAIALAGLLVTSSILGFTKGETERIWLPYAPLACIAAATILPRKRLTPILLGLAAQALLFELAFNTIW